MDQRNGTDRRLAELVPVVHRTGHSGGRPVAHSGRSVPTEAGDLSDGVDEQSEQSFPASDPPSWSGLSL
jgi:hypothetical protein